MHTLTETNRTPPKKYKKLISARTYEDTYHMLNESQQNSKPGRQHSTRKKTGRKKRRPTRNRKREGGDEKNKNKPTLTTQEIMQHARGIRILRAPKERGGDVAPRRNIRITESATKESREDKIKREEGDTRNKRETTGRKDTTNENGTRKGKGGTQTTAKNCRWLKST